MTSPRTAGRLERILTLLRRIGTNKSLNADGLAKELQVSRRTIFRDLDLLRSAGVMIRIDQPETGYQVDTAQHRVSSLADSDILTLLTHASASALPRSETGQTQLDRAISQLGATLPTDLQPELERINRMAVNFKDCSGHDYRETIDTLTEAIVMHYSVTVSLKANREGFVEPLELAPLRVQLHLGRWMLDAVRLSDHSKLRIALELIEVILVANEPMAAKIAAHLRQWSKPDFALYKLLKHE